MNINILLLCVTYVAGRDKRAARGLMSVGIFCLVRCLLCPSCSSVDKKLLIFGQSQLISINQLTGIIQRFSRQLIHFFHKKMNLNFKIFEKLITNLATLLWNFFDEFQSRDCCLTDEWLELD